jgi:hypothetical protein
MCKSRKITIFWWEIHFENTHLEVRKGNWETPSKGVKVESNKWG